MEDIKFDIEVGAPVPVLPPDLGRDIDAAVREVINNIGVPPGFSIARVDLRGPRLHITIRDMVNDRFAEAVVHEMDLARMRPDEWVPQIMRKVEQAVAVLMQAGAIKQNTELKAEAQQLRADVERLKIERDWAMNVSAGRREALDQALRFIAGLNLQDHPVALQREQRQRVQQLMQYLNPERVDR